MIQKPLYLGGALILATVEIFSVQTSVTTLENTRASSRWLLFSTMMPGQWPVATGADKELVDAKTRVHDLVIESLTLCHSAWGEKKLYRELRRVRRRCSWEHRYDNGTDPISL